MTSIRPTRRLVLTAGLAALAAPALGRNSPPTVGIGGPAFGTRWRATLATGGDPGRLRDAIMEELARIDRLMSPWRPDSAITAFNSHQATGWQVLDTELAAVTSAALTIHAASGGAYDPAVGPAVARWGFGPIEGAYSAGGPAFEVAGDALRKRAAGMTLDLCGIAKGHALDRMVHLLRDRGPGDFVIDLGGEIAAFGRHPDGRRWQVAVEDPRPDRTGAAEVVALDGLAIATSGDRNNGFTVGHRRFSHIIDPRTAAPVEGAAASVSVLSDSATTADGWATALMAAGSGGPALARQRGLDALFLFRDGEGLRRLPVGRFDDHLA